jgi:hypothetical protein
MTTITTTTSTAAATAPARAARRQQQGPPLLAPVIAYGVLMAASVILLAHGPQPPASAAAVLRYDQAHRTVLEVAGCLGFAASLPLAIWAAAVYRRLRTGPGVVAPGAVIGLAGGLLAAVSLAVTGLITWTSSAAGTLGDPALARVLADFSFATGSAGFVAPLALLIAGIAVPSLIMRLLPRPVAWAGLVIAAVSAASTFALLTAALDFTFPVGRFAGLIWLVVASVLLPRTRHEVRGRRPAAAGRVA